MYKFLYTYLVFDISLIFSSKAKFKVLRTLFHQSTPLSLRQVAYLSEESLFSVQRALEQLVSQGLLLKKNKGHRMFFFVSQKHPYHAFLATLFDLEMKTRVSLESNQLHRKAAQCLKFSTEAHHLIQKARS